MKKNSGFTLIELMIVVAVIGVLAAIAIPNYNEYVVRSRITEALSALSQMATKLEQHFQDNRSYTTACAVAGTAAVAALPPDTNNFAFSCVPAADTYVVTATGINKMDGFVYTINQVGAKTTTLSAAAGKVTAGWAGTGSACWVLNKSGGC